jgi:hypothetical protein
MVWSVTLAVKPPTRAIICGMRSCPLMLSAIVACVVQLGGPDVNARTMSGSVSGAKVLGDRIASLGQNVRPDEAQLVAERAYATVEGLRQKYGVTWPPLFNNFLVNVGIHKRGLCFQFAEDLLLDLDSLKTTSLELHWGAARAGQWGEHNCVVVTAKGQPFRDGILLDTWRLSGHLFWSTVTVDHFPWIEDSEYAAILRRKFAAKRMSALAEEHSTPVSHGRHLQSASSAPARSFY